jgi:hypothetical protein
MYGHGSPLAAADGGIYNLAMNTRSLVWISVAAVAPLFAQPQIFSASFTPSNRAGAPFSAIETTQRILPLADGTRAQQTEDDILLYRDSAGRTRVEFPSPRGPIRGPAEATIVDPVAGFRYQFNSRDKIVRRYALPPTRPAVPAQPPPPGIVVEPEVEGVVSTHLVMDGAVRGIGAAVDHFKTTSEYLGKHKIEEVLAGGRRVTTTLEAGAVGNQAEMVVTDERWFSEQLGVLVWTRMSDPRFGDTSRLLVDIRVAEPDAALFVPPADYTIEDVPKN